MGAYLAKEDKKTGCKSGKHKYPETFKCENTDCEEIICKACRKNYNEMRICIECKIVMIRLDMMPD